MTHSMEPSGFLGDRTPTAATWHWRLLDAQGAEVTLPADTVTVDGPRFTSQGDAESWVGECWRELVDQGVASVVLLDGDREVYGPMSLSA
jgi:hypothetical protein